MRVWVRVFLGVWFLAIAATAVLADGSATTIEAPTKTEVGQSPP